MTIGRREALLLISLGLVIYIFIGANFIWIDFIQNFKSVSSDYLSTKDEYNKIKHESDNIKVLESQLNSSKVTYERLDEYLKDYETVVDGVDFAKKLSLVSPTGIRGISVSSPEIKTVGTDGSATDKTSGGPTYMGINVSFTAQMNFQQIIEFINYIESNSKKTKITNFDMVSNSEKSEDGSMITSNAFDVSMAVEIYSLGDGAESDIRMYKNNQYLDNVENPISTGEIGEPVNSNIDTEVVNNDETENTEQQQGDNGDINNGVNNESIIPNENNSRNTTGNEVSTTLNQKKKLELYLDGYHVGGENLRIYGFEKFKDSIFKKTKESEQLKINFKNSFYTINLSNDKGGLEKINGSLPLEDIITMDINVSFSEADVDKNLKVDIMFVNESKKNIQVKLIDKARRIIIIDRKGTKITGSSSEENLKII